MQQLLAASSEQLVIIDRQVDKARAAEATWRFVVIRLGHACEFAVNDHGVYWVADIGHQQARGVTGNAGDTALAVDFIEAASGYGVQELAAAVVQTGNRRHWAGHITR